MEKVAEAKLLKPEIQTELLNFLLALADTKHALGLRYAEWCDTAPRLEAGVAASAMAQDQLGQVRVLYGLIQEQFPAQPHDFDDETRKHSFSLSYLDEPFPNWATFVAANLLVGSGITVIEEALTESLFEPLSDRMPKMLEEERFHHVHAEGWFRTLGESRQAANLGSAIEAILPQMLCWFGDAQHIALTEEKIITLQPGDLRERYLERVGPFVSSTIAVGLLRYHESSRSWSYVGALPWGEFDAVTRRIVKRD
jgi:1,2-phenylacetyl-CoA epoxidase catalytic subunit